jgi:antitoxin component YwqK of YwqJK toxin-antitoxin module
MEKIKKGLFKKTLIILCLFIFAPTVGFSEVKKTYYESGKLKDEYTFKNGKGEGPLEIYYESGALKEEYTNKNGKFEGPCKTYYESGALEEEVTYKKGKREGPFKIYDEGGQLIAEGNLGRVNGKDLIKNIMKAEK